MPHSLRVQEWTHSGAVGVVWCGVVLSSDGPIRWPKYDPDLGPKLGLQKGPKYDPILGVIFGGHFGGQFDP